MNSTRISPFCADTPFAYWMKLCLLPAEIFYEAFNGDRDTSFSRRCGFQVMVMTAVLAAVCGGTGLAIWGLVELTTFCLRRTRRRMYYPSEAERRRRLAAERRKIRRRTTINAAPTAEELLAQFARVKRNPQEMIRFGSMLEDLEAYVDNSLRRNAEGTIIGRNPGIKGWLAENCAELAVKYSTVMRYKALAKQFRQAVGLRDPYPAAVALPDAAEDECEITVRTDTDEGIEGSEITVRKSSREIALNAEIGLAREAAAAFFGKCKATQRGLVTELDTRLRPELAPEKFLPGKRILRGLSPTSGHSESVRSMLA